MAKQINCECGYIARGETENEVVARIRDHMRSDHPELLERSPTRTSGDGSKRHDRPIGGSDEHGDV